MHQLLRQQMRIRHNKLGLVVCASKTGSTSLAKYHCSIPLLRLSTNESEALSLYIIQVCSNLEVLKNERSPNFFLDPMIPAIPMLTRYLPQPPHPHSPRSGLAGTTLILAIDTLDCTAEPSSASGPPTSYVGASYPIPDLGPQRHFSIPVAP
jgi:hypothetical protein